MDHSTEQVELRYQRGIDWQQAAQFAMLSQHDAEQARKKRTKFCMHQDAPLQDQLPSIQFPAQAGSHIRRETDSFLRGGTQFRQVERNGQISDRCQRQASLPKRLIGALKRKVRERLQAKLGAGIDHADIQTAHLPSVNAGHFEEVPFIPTHGCSPLATSKDETEVFHATRTASFYSEQFRISGEAQVTNTTPVKPLVPEVLECLDTGRRNEFMAEASLQRAERRALFCTHDSCDETAISVVRPYQLSDVDMDNDQSHDFDPMDGIRITPLPDQTDDQSLAHLDIADVDNSLQTLRQRKEPRSATTEGPIDTQGNSGPRTSSAELRDLTLNHWSSDGSHLDESYEFQHESTIDYAQSKKQKTLEAIHTTINTSNVLDSLNTNIDRSKNESPRSSFERLSANAADAHCNTHHLKEQRVLNLVAEKENCNTSQKHGKVKMCIRDFEDKIGENSIQAGRKRPLWTPASSKSYNKDMTSMQFSKTSRIFSRGTASQSGANDTITDRLSGNTTTHDVSTTAPAPPDLNLGRQTHSSATLSPSSMFV